MYYIYSTHKLNTPHYIIVTQTKSHLLPWYNCSKIAPNQSHYTKLEHIYVNINGNEQADKLAKEGLDLTHRSAIHSYEHAHATPYYYYQKDEWPSMIDTPDKGPDRFLEKTNKKI